jgi:membrane-bound lytic murein transglycosylase B
MNFQRAAYAFAAAWLGLAVPVGSMAQTPVSAPVPAAAPASPATAATPELSPEEIARRFREVLDEAGRRATSQGVSARTLTAALANIEPDLEVLDLSRRQPEFTSALWDYLGRLVSQQRIADGRQKLDSEKQTLADVEATLSVDRHVVLAIWGVESNFGTRMGDRVIVRSLATLAAADERRAAFWRGELVAALRILERGDNGGRPLVGSWAGAMGHTQFIPSTYLQHAMDFDGDGRRDIWGSVPDALGSTARYLKTSGWLADRPCLVEVALPASFDYGLAAPGTEKTFAQWAALGIKPVGDGTNSAWAAAKRLPGPAQLRVLLPAGAAGPAFLVTQNFNAVLRYNQSIAYALAVCHLADRLAGGDPILASWPVDDPPLARADREEVQRLLTTLGYDVGGVDGLIGGRTQAALRAYQRANGLPADGYASQRLLERLRRSAGL